VSVIELDRRAVHHSVEIVARVGPDDLGRPTPCAGWTLRELLEHMTVQHRGFALAAGGVRSDVADWRPRSLGDDPAGAYAAAADQVVAAFAAERVAEREFWLPEIRDGGPFPAQLAIGFHLVDYVVHAWDVAASLGVCADAESDLVEAALRVAAGVPDGPERLLPGAAFAPSHAAPAGASGHDRLLAMLGRDPRWSR
jgi:uncharacterized protein (TIGR03086 family)